MYAQRYPDALLGIVVESACLCFRERLADPSCALSPFFPAWRAALTAADLLDPNSHLEPSAGDDTEWIEVPGVGEIFRRRGGPALLVAPGALSGEMKSAMPAFWEFDARSWISSVSVPTLVIAGSADPIVPVHCVRAVHESIATSDFISVEGGHVPSMQGGADVSRAFKRFRRRLRSAKA
jgi:pimeloyl-ACP methyl ester carboxylesterase